MKIYLSPEKDALGEVFHVSPEKIEEFDEALLELFSRITFSLEDDEHEIRIIQDDILDKLQEESTRCTSLQEIAFLFFQAGMSMCSMQYMIQAVREGVKEIKDSKKMFGRDNLN